jgi:peptidoglycan hydrolase-like protein with peptidoglycan-binding domain
MGSFYDSIKSELDALDASETGGPGAASGAPDATTGSTFGTDFNSNPTVVKQVQAAINAAGYTPALKVDGAYGPSTAAGVKWLQAKQGVDQDGIIGDQTLGSLGITPPTGTSIASITGAAKGMLAALEAEFAPLLNWAKKFPQPVTQGKGVAPGFQATRTSTGRRRSRASCRTCTSTRSGT